MTTKDQKELAQKRIMKSISFSLLTAIAVSDEERAAFLEQAARVGRLFGYTSFPGLGKFDKKIVKLDNNYELELE